MKNTGFMANLQSFHQQAIDAFSLSCPDAAAWDDFGEPEYTEALRVLAQSLDQSKELSDGVAQIMRGNIVEVLKGRLYSEYYWHAKGRNNTQAPSISKPIFIIGLPRSGTTALHKLLAADPANQGLDYWLGVTPMPRPPREQWSRFIEFQQCDQRLKFIAEVAPQMKEIHDMAANQVDECRLLLMQSFMNVTFQSSAWIPEYEQWLYQADFTKAYQRYKRNLQLIAANEPADNPRRWVLKDPSHLWAPETVLKTFPDACIIQLHRDPCALIPSVASLVYTSRQMVEPDIDKHRVGRRELQQWSQLLKNLERFRHANPEVPAYDMRMEDLQRNPVDEIAAAYKHFGIDFSEQARQGIVAWQAGQGVRSGTHRYTAEEFGLTEQQIRQAFSG